MHIIDHAQSLYSNPLNRYHNWRHVEFVLGSYIQVFGEQPSANELLAILFHDCVYVAGSSPMLNETLSALEFRRAFKVFKPTRADVDMVEKMILATRAMNYMQESFYCPDSARVMDCDVASLAIPYSEFLQNNANIIYENAGPIYDYEMEICARASIDFLLKLSSRTRIYRTSQAIAQLEDAARDNIKRFAKNPEDIYKFLEKISN